MDDEEVYWRMCGKNHNWKMPIIPRWKRLPIVRHILTWKAMWEVERWYTYGPGSIGIPTGYDNWVLDGMWNNWESLEND